MRFLILLPLILFLACESAKDKDNKIVNPPILKEEFAQTINKAEELELGLAEDIILQGATVRQTIAFRSLLRDIKLDLFVLRERPQDQDTLAHLFTVTKQIRRIPMQARDEEFLIPFLTELDLLMLQISRYQNVRLNDLNWEVWTENFNNGLNQFTTFSKGDNWVAENRNRQGYVSVRSKNTNAWLISPKIKLEGVYNPAVQLDHLLNIKVNEATEVDKELVNRSLKVLVSLNYEYGDPNAASWEELNLEDVNLITDFNSSLSNKISLARYEDQTISLAFVLDVKSREIGGHGLLWQINELKIWGATENDELEVLERVDPTVYAFQHDFADGLERFEQLTEGDSALFQATERNGVGYIQASGHNPPKTGSTILVSPAIDLADGDYSLRMSQTRNFYAASAQEKKFIQVMIGIDNEDLNAIEWTELNFERVPPGDSWDLVESEWLALNLKDQKIRIGFRYESNEATGEFPNWAIYTMDIREE